MKASAPLPVRVYEFLLRRLVPSLGDGYTRDAAAAFGALAAEARARGPRALLVFALRETRSLLATAMSEFRARRQARTEAKAGRERTASGLSRGRRPHRSGGPRAAGPRGLRGMPRILDALALDVRYALRNLARTPGFVAVSVLSLTFGIAVSTVLFSVANAVFLRPLPHAESPEALVRIFSGETRNSRGPLSFPDYLDLREATETLDGVAAARSRNFYVGSPAEASRRIRGMEVSENYFEVLGIRMARGRAFLAEDMEAGGAVAVIGHQLWQQRFAGDPGVLGETLLLDGRPHTLIGVGPPGMVSPEAPALLEIVVPTVQDRERRGLMAFTGVGRLKEGATLSRVQAELDVFAQHLAEEYPDSWNHSGRNPRGLNVLTLRQAMVPDNSIFFAAMGGFLAAVGLILLITCSNVANLLLIRAFRRREEIAVRCAIGAPGRRILAQLLTENLLLFGMAGALSLFLIHWLISLSSAGFDFLPPTGVNFDVDGRVMAFTLGLALFAGLTFGLAPALQASRPNLVQALKGRTTQLRFRRFGLRNLLVGAQVGGSVVFVLVTLLLLQGLSHAGTLDLGFDAENVAVLSLDLEHGEYGEADGRQFLDDLKARLEAVSGVEGAEVSTWIPLEGGGMYMGGLEPEGWEPGPQESPTVGMTVVSPGYLDLLRVPLLEGRGLGPEDDANAEEVVLVSRAFVDRYWPGERGIGKRIGRETGDPFTVVGVVDDVSFLSPGEEPSPHIWIPFGQYYFHQVRVHVRTAGDSRPLLPVLRQQVADLKPNLPILRADLMENVTANATILQRILSLVMGIAGAVTLGLAMLGIYGVVAFSVRQRTREVGLRIALGAEPARVVRMVVREGLGLAFVGLVPGVLVSLVAARLLRALFLGASPMDPLALGGGLGLLLAAVMAASLAPALRAAKADPMESLRAE